MKTLLLLFASTLVFSGCSQREQSQSEPPENIRFKALEKFDTPNTSIEGIGEEGSWV
jgi:predicted component of type VI protein secretion system